MIIVVLIVFIIILLILLLYFAFFHKSDQIVLYQQNPLVCDVGNRVKFIEIKKEPCNGTCPTYSAIIYKDGYVEFNGIQHVALIGNKQFQLSYKEMWYLSEDFKKLNFFCLEDEYDGPIIDLPTTIITAHKTNTIKTVKARYGIPYKLKIFITKLHNLLMSHLYS